MTDMFVWLYRLQGNVFESILHRLLKLYLSFYSVYYVIFSVSKSEDSSISTEDRTKAVELNLFQYLCILDLLDTLQTYINSIFGKSTRKTVMYHLLNQKSKPGAVFTVYKIKSLVYIKS